MKRIAKFTDRVAGLSRAVTRYPATTAFFAAASALIAISIENNGDYFEIMVSCIIGAVICAVLQAFYERFFDKPLYRFAFMGIGAVLALAYYGIIQSVLRYSSEIGIRTSIILLALFFAYIWAPSIKSRVSFNESFLATFKAFFQSALYAIVIFLGCLLIFSATDLLIFDIDSDIYGHTANLVFVLFFPLFFLSLIPVYPGKSNNNEIDLPSIERATMCPKFLEILISYIIIPLTEVFTVILLLYILMNIGGEFWTDNLLEPLLISYTITVIVVYILASRLENKFAALFRKIIPKILIPIVLFQILSSSMMLRETGITHPRYLTILFGIFALCAGLVMSVASVQKNGIIAAMLILFSAIAITPPVDAFTVSRLSQQNRLKTALTENGMLENNVIIPKNDISEADKTKIKESVDYLYRMRYINRTPWLPEDFVPYEDFYDTFGFYQNTAYEQYRYVNVYLASDSAINISGYNTLVQAHINPALNAQTLLARIELSGEACTLTTKTADGEQILILTDANSRELISLSLNEMLIRYSAYPDSKSDITQAEATFSTENDHAKLAIIVQNAHFTLSDNPPSYYAEVYVLASLKS